MRASPLVLASALLALCTVSCVLGEAAAAAPAADTGFVNTKVDKRVDLTKHAVRVSLNIMAKSSSGKSKYRFLIPSAENDHVSFITAKGADGAKIEVRPNADRCVFGLSIARPCRFCDVFRACAVLLGSRSTLCGCPQLRRSHRASKCRTSSPTC
jgi:hypothetical protein